MTRKRLLKYPDGDVKNKAFSLRENENALHNLAVHIDTENKHALTQQFHKMQRKKYKNVHVEKALFERGEKTGNNNNSLI